MYIIVHRDENDTVVATYYHIEMDKVAAKLNELATEYEAEVDEKVEWEDDKLGWHSRDDDTQARIYTGNALV